MLREKGWHRYSDVHDLGAVVGLGDLLQVGQQHGYDLHRRERALLAAEADLDSNLAPGALDDLIGLALELIHQSLVGQELAQQPLRLEHGVFQVHHSHRLSCLTNMTPVVAKAHEGGRAALRGLVGDDVDATLARQRHHAIVRAKVDAHRHAHRRGARSLKMQRQPQNCHGEPPDSRRAPRTTTLSAPHAFENFPRNVAAGALESLPSVYYSDSSDFSSWLQRGFGGSEFGKFVISPPR